MSDDLCLGKSCCCVPRRVFVLLVAFGHLAYWSSEAFYFFVFRWLLHSDSFTPRHCWGNAKEHQNGQRTACHEVIGCAGMFEASRHTYMAVFLLGGVIFGYLGTHGAYHGTARDVHRFACYMVGKAACLLSIAAFDGLYFEVCNGYPFQVVSEAILWRMPGVPIDDTIKQQVSMLTAYPVGFLNPLLQHGTASSLNIWLWYLVPLFLQVLFWLYVARECWAFADLVAFGEHGLGATYNLRTWRDGVLSQRAVQGFFARTKELAAENVRDIYEDISWKTPVPARPYRQRPPNVSSYGGVAVA